MTALIALAFTAADLTVTAFTARFLYGYWRARHIDADVAESIARDMQIYKETRETPEEYLAAAVASFDSIWRGGTRFAAFASAVVWPISLPVIGAVRFASWFMDGTKVRPRAEVAAERDAMVRRIGELEKELKIP